MPKPKSSASAKPLASQTLFRGLDIVDVVASGVTTLPAISEKTGITPSTAHRLASALVQIGYLRFEARKGYSLGSKLMELGFLAYRQADLPSRARSHLEKLAAETSDTVHLAVIERNEVVYLDKLPGQRPVEISSRIGGRKPLCTTGVGKALLLDKSEDEWHAQYQHDIETIGKKMTEAQWIELMRRYAKLGYAFDLGEDEGLIRCVAAPIHDASDKVVAAISVSSTVEYMSDDRMSRLIPVVRKTADDISIELGSRRFRG